MISKLSAERMSDLYNNFNKNPKSPEHEHEHKHKDHQLTLIEDSDKMLDFYLKNRVCNYCDDLDNDDDNKIKNPVCKHTLFKLS